MSQKKKTHTIRDIAKLANVSYQTISLVINDKPGVSEMTRQRILRLMEELEYRPNHAAQMLTTHRSKTLELIVCDVTYGGRLADSTKNMVRTARAAGYNLLIAESDSTHLSGAFESATARMVDGVLLYAPRLHITDAEMLDLCSSMPLVRRDYLPGSKLAWVGFDQGYATRLVTEHVIALGHRQIAAIPPDLDLLNGYWRYNTWRNVLIEHGLQPGPAFHGDYSMSSGYEAAHKIVDSGQPFTAIVVGSDNMAIGALRALSERGLRVPDDVSVVGYDNTEQSMYTTPSLTTVDFKFARQDELAVRYLIERINNPLVELHQHVLMSELTIRESARALDGGKSS